MENNTSMKELRLKDDEDYRVAWNYLAFAAWRTNVEIITFALMANHIHELVACQE